ncbi:ATP-binding protein [Paenibacillus sp. IHBB 10380]|uniref:ATP-binding protein n=1 Tax=Paenibacillus sp. IHBB 10380 TaxID=1566358 RepID=UPI0006981D02|nr:ATP-binding protein [Paenibacillus sp. IHBB 10380]
MIKKSLRVRIVSTFIIIVLASLFLSFGITSLFSERKVTLEQQFLTITGDIATLLDLTDPDQRDKVMDILSDYHIYGAVIKEGSELPFSLTETKVSPLFQSTTSEPLFLDIEKGPNPVRLIGVPNIDNSGSSLILKMDFTGFLEIMQRILLVGLFIVLLIGSFLILLAAHYIVEPVKRLTSAAKEMATGNLTVRLKHKKKDEFGELMDSFNHMASELQKIDKMREDFVSNVSHEIQSPITSIRGFTVAIRDGIIPADRQKEHLEIIYQETLRLSKLSDHLLRLASLDSEHHPYHPVKYRLDEQLRRVILVAEPLWTEKNLDIELDLQACPVKADHDLFEQVWQNLINNAIKYSDEDGVIEVIMEVNDLAVRVHITDTGKGIPEIDLPHIFDRFYMVDKARSQSDGGNGLGLSIARKIVELHDCKIEVKSTEGKGTCFTVSIPL